MKKSIAINQPTFLPWIGWFDLLDQTDIFVILDDVQFSKQSWQQRNRIKTDKGLELIIVPVKNKKNQTILEVEILNNSFEKKIIKSVLTNYKKSKYFDKYFKEFSYIIKKSIEEGNLSKLNINLIKWFIEILNIKKKIFYSSEIDVKGKRSEYIAKICQYFNCNLYVSPIGAKTYISQEKYQFAKRNIEVKFQNYAHPLYSQLFKPFIPYASILDLVFNEGQNSYSIMISGRKKLLSIEDFKNV